jgi:DNA processing protein
MSSGTNLPSGLPEREWFALARAPGMHADHLRAAAAHGPVTRLPGSSAASLAALGLPPAAVAWLTAPDAARVDADRTWAAQAGVQLLTVEHALYPPLLGVTTCAPLALWVRGEPAVLCAGQFAIVGSRRATAGGRRNAAMFARELALAGLVITSGLAAGIDAAAHEGALEAGGFSVAVCGTGLDQCYPAGHEALAGRIAARGAVVSEFPPGTEPRPENFPRRNRIISGLAHGVLVVEAARDSGSLITARLAGEQGRHVMAVPGSILSGVSRGCHELLRQGAALIETPRQVLAELQWTPESPFDNQPLAVPDLPPDRAHRLDKAGEMLLDALGFEPASIDDLIDRTGQQAGDVAARLMLLELEGLVEALPGGRYGRVPHPANRKVN